MSEIVIIILNTIGSAFILIASIGILRMPDFYLRLSVTVKAATLGLGLLLFSAAIYFATFAVTTKVMAILFFLLLTSPVAAHMIARSAYFTGTKLWDKSIRNDLKGMYDSKTHELSSEEKIEEKDINQSKK